MQTIWHPQPDEDGNPVIIRQPSVATDLAYFSDVNKIASFVPHGPEPAFLAGIAFAPWSDAPTTLEGWASVAGQIALNEPPLLLHGIKRAAAGAVIEEPDGRIWLVSPTNGFGGYQQTFPKGKADEELPLQAVAIKECFEETGLQIAITGIVGDFERSTSTTRYYSARRISGSPCLPGWETQAVHLVPKALLFSMLNTAADRLIAQHLGVHA